MFKRDIEPLLKKVSTQFPAIVLTGPRQAGKTTLLQYCFPDHIYLNLESPETLFKIKYDPNGFFNNEHKQWIIDEAQNWPELFSYIQIFVDTYKKPGQFILSGSQNFLLLEKVSQTLAGRAVILELLPLSYNEYKSNSASKDLDIWDFLFQGSYPRPYHEALDTQLWYQSYLRTYIERDVRSIINIKDLAQFQLFLKLCAGQHGQLLNQSAIAQACGLTQTTVNEWLSLLEASYIIYRLKPYHKNFKKRLVKTPKLYFYDSALVTHLLGIDSATHLQIHSARGHIFEGFVITECIKKYTSLGKTPPVYFWRDHTGNEIDLMLAKAEAEIAIEIKSSQTLNPSFIQGLTYWQKISNNPDEFSAVVYSGKDKDYIGRIAVHTWRSISDMIF